MVALAGAFAFIVPYGSQATPDTVISARPEIVRIGREFEFTPTHSPTGRYEIAATLAQAISTAEAALTDLASDRVGPAAEVRARLTTRSLPVTRAFVANLDTLRRLTKEFRAELGEMGADERWVAKKLDRLAASAGSAPVSNLLQADKKTVAQVEPEIERLIETFGIRISHKPIVRRPMLNWEAAIILHAIIAQSEKAVEEFDGKAARLAWDGWGSTVTARTADLQMDLRSARAMRTNEATVARLIDTFTYELGLLGLDVPAERQSVRRIANRAPHLHAPRPGEAYAPFPDVPQDHWAAKSIQNLRMAGILRGQPDGTFRGN